MFFNLKKFSYFLIFTIFTINCKLKNNIKNNNFKNLIENNDITNDDFKNLIENNDITNDDFKNLVKNKSLFFVIFYMDTCPPCMQTKPIYEELSREFPNITFLEINVKDSSKEEIFLKLDIYSVPTIICIKNKKVIWRNTGFIDKVDFKKKINSLIK